MTPSQKGSQAVAVFKTMGGMFQSGNFSDHQEIFQLCSKESQVFLKRRWDDFQLGVLSQNMIFSSPSPNVIVRKETLRNLKFQHICGLQKCTYLTHLTPCSWAGQTLHIHHSLQGSLTLNWNIKKNHISDFKYEEKIGDT